MHIQRQNEAFAYRVATKPKSFDYTLVDRLEQEFNDWATKNNITNPSDLPWAPRGPIGHWPNIENFLKTNYPASYRNLAMGDELTRPLLDRGGTPKYRADPLGSPPRANPDEEASQQPYETGPDAVAQHGYDPKEVAAAMLLLHDDSHIGRTLLKRDQNRLFDIVKKRHQMQEAYDQAHIAIRLAYNTIRCAMPWYHVSPKDLPEGTVLVPGEGSWNNNVHITDSPEHGRYWYNCLLRDLNGEELIGHENLYEVEPSENPREWSRNFDFIAPSAVVKRKVTMPQAPEYGTPEYQEWYRSTWPARNAMSHNTIRCGSVTVPVGSRDGLHMTPSMLISNKAKKLSGPVFLVNEAGQWADCTNPMEIMGLGAQFGHKITIHTSNPDDAAVMADYIQQDHG